MLRADTTRRAGGGFLRCISDWNYQSFANSLMRWKLTVPLPEHVCWGINYLDALNILPQCYKTGAERCISVQGAAALSGTAIWTLPAATD